MNKPIVSIVMPAFNAEKTIYFSINSILNQNFREWELLIVNDGSTDATLEVIGRFNDNRIAVITQQNQGVAAARNLGMKNARGEFIAFLDADDLWFSSKLKNQIDLFSNASKDVGLLYSSYRGFKANPKDSFSIENQPVNIHVSEYYKLLVSDFIGTLTVMIRREVVSHVGYFRVDLRGTEDWDYWIRISKRYKLQKINKELALYRISPQSLSGNKIRHMNEELKVLKAQAHLENGIPANVIHMAYLFWSIKAMKNPFLIFRREFPVKYLVDSFLIKNMYPKNFFILLWWVISNKITKKIYKNRN